MKTRTTILAVMAVLALFLTPKTARAQDYAFPLVSLYDLDSTVAIYCKTTGLQGKVNTEPLPINLKITTAGVATTTVTSISPGTNAAFDSIAAGDLIIIPPGADTAYAETDQKHSVVVTAKASANSITVSSNLTIADAGTTFWYRKAACTTTDSNTAGWFSTKNMRTVQISALIGQIDVSSGGIKFSFQCRHRDSAGLADEVYTGTYTSATVGSNGVVLDILHPMDECRVAMNLTGTDDGVDTTTHAEQVNISVRMWAQNSPVN